ncbi:MAG: hypothetical protein H7061_09950 [Bdellovibrionaceae bacterium]|nr:hypothetical protein [Bdellovibrio sp.]
MTAWIEADTAQKTFVNSIFELSERKILSIEEYWAEPFAAHTLVTGALISICFAIRNFLVA